jgi:hypothetical protein
MAMQNTRPPQSAAGRLRLTCANHPTKQDATTIKKITKVKTPKILSGLTYRVSEIAPGVTGMLYFHIEIL